MSCYARDRFYRFNIVKALQMKYFIYLNYILHSSASTVTKPSSQWYINGEKEESVNSGECILGQAEKHATR